VLFRSTELRFDGKGGASIHRDADEANTFEASSGFGQGGDLLSTAVNSSGSPVTGRALMDTDRIRYMGFEVDLRTAQRNGWVSQDALGNWSATDQGNAGATPQQAPMVETRLGDGGTVEAAEAAAFRADDAAEAAMTTLINSVSMTTNMALFNSLLREEEGGERHIISAAEQAGVSPEEMAAVVETAIEGLDRALDARLAGLGVHDPELFADWLEQRHEGTANGAFMNLILHNSTAGFEELAIQFSQQLDTIAPDDVAEALTEAGLPFRRVQGQTIIQFPDGTQSSFEVAVKQGLIKLSRNI